MEKSWYPLPFPQCPSCLSAWVSCVHKGCSGHSDLEVEPFHQTVKCPSCNTHWGLLDSTFYCSCGAIFNALQVKVAVDEVVRATRALHEELARYQFELELIKFKKEASFNVFVSKLAEIVGGAAGFLIGKILGILN
jgi:hypothetical protein